MGWQDDPVVAPAAQSGGSWQDDPVVQPAQSEQPGIVKQVGRQLALTGRAGLESAADVVSIPANALAGILNLGLKAAGIDYQFPEQSAAFSGSLTQAGVPEPATDAERFANTAARRVGSTGITMGAAAPIAGAPGITGQVAKSVASNPVVQGVSAVTGPTAAEVARQSGASPAAQVVADVAGTIAPGLSSYMVPEAVRRGFRGGEQGRQAVQESIDTFRDAGTTPSVGQATQGRFAQATESLLSRTPGGAGRMSAKASAQADEIGAALERQAAALSPKASGEQAGRAIVKGVSGEGGFVDTFKTKQGELYDKLDTFIPKDKLVDVSKTRKALDALNVDIEGAPSISAFFKNAKIGGIKGALESDVATGAGAGLMNSPENGKLPYEALKKLRTLVGNEMADSWAGSDVPRSKWKALYGALSEDLKVAASDAGPGGRTAWERANNFSRAGMSRIEVLSSVIEKNGGPEKVFQAATSGTKEGATTLRAVMQSLPEDGQKTLTATVLRRLGNAKAGVQNDTGSQFSTETFLTNWNSLSPEAKRVLFDRFGPGFRQNMDQVAKVAANLRTGSKVFVNPSGTAQAATQYTTVGAFAMSVLTGNYTAGGAIAGTAVAANGSARLMANPNFVKWLATATKAPIGARAALINQLGRGDSDMKAFAQILKKSNADQQQEDRRQQQDK